MSVAELEKTIRNLRKKVSGIEDLEKKTKGSKLDAAQKDKIKRKPELLKELKEARAKLEALQNGGDVAADDVSPAASPEAAAAPEPEAEVEVEAEPEPEAAPATPPRTNGHDAEEDASPAAASPPGNAETEEVDKEIKKIDKKLRDINALKDRKKKEEEENGKSTLNADQLKKIKGAHALQQELQKLKDKREKILRGDSGAKNKKKKKEEKHADPEPEAEAEEDDDDPFKVDRSRLIALYNEFDMAQDVKRKIAMGKIKKPTPVQLGKAKMCDVLQKAISDEEDRIENEVKRLRVAAGLPAVPLTPQEQALLELEARKKKAIEEEDFDEAKHVKKLIERVTEGATIEEAEQAEKDQVAAVKKAAEEAEAKRVAEEEAEAARKAAEEAEAERIRAEEEAVAEKKRKEEEAAAAAQRREEEKVQKEKEKAERKQREKEEKEEAARKAEEEAAEARRLAEEERKRPKTEEEFRAGLTFFANKNKGGGNSPNPDDQENGDDAGEVRLTFDEMMKQAKAKRKSVTEPYMVSFGKGSPAPKRTGTAAPREGILSKQATRRILRDLRDLAECPLYTVKAESQPDDLFTWYANVAPVEGPYAGSVIHFAIYFPDSYPLEPPVVRCCTPIQHMCVENTSRYTGEVCLHVNDRQAQPTAKNHRKGWSPSYDARTVLTHLASMFDAEYFKGDKKGVEKKLKADKVAVQNYTCKDTNHSLSMPVPAVPCFNGPFDDDMPRPLVIEQGAVWCRDAQRAGHYWQHNFTESGKHYFRGVLRKHDDADEEGFWALGWATPEGNVVEPGADEFTWAYYPLTGEIMHNGERTQTGVTAAAGDIVDSFLDLDAGIVSFTVNGTEITETMTGLDAAQLYHPTFSLGNGYGVELLFTPNAVALPPSSLPVASVSSVVDEKPLCYVTKEGADDQVLGVGLQVVRDGNNVSDIFPEADVISQESFQKSNVRKSLRDSSALTTFLPLLLGPHHSAKARPILERMISETLRNPRANLPSYYTPPFKPANVNVVMPKVLEGIVETFVRLTKGEAPSSYAISRTVRLFSHISHAYKALVTAHGSIVDDANKRVEDEDVAFGPSILCLPATSSTEEHLDDLISDTGRGGFTGKRKTEVTKLAVLLALLGLFKDTTLDEFHANHGEPTAEQVEKFREAVAAITGAESVADALQAGGAPESALEKL